MRSRSFRSIIVAAFLLAAPAAVFGQSFFFGGGPTFPTGAYGDEDQTAAKTGFVGIVGATWDIGDGGLWAGGEGFYGQNNHSDGDEKTNPYGGMAILGYGTGDGDGLGFYFFGGAGLMVHKYTNNDDPAQNSSDSNFGYQFGAGLDIPLSGSVSLFGEGRFMGATETTFIGALAGLSIGFDS